MRATAAAVTLLLGASVGLAQEPSDDACRTQLPVSLQRSLADTFPNHRAPLVSDNLAEDVTFNREAGGTGCLGVATGDFDGNGKGDYALLMSPKKSGEGFLVVALQVGTKWQFRILRRFESDSRLRLYVERGDPGEYFRSKSLEGKLEPHERASLKSRTPCVVTGQTESSSVAYCRTAAGWVYVWTSD